MSGQIIDKNLSRIVKIKMTVSQLNNIEEIEEISIQDVNFADEKLNIDLTELVKMKGLKKLSLKFFEITDEVIDSINKLECIQEIKFSMCIFKTKKPLCKKLKVASIYNCQEFEVDILKENGNLEELLLICSGLINAVDLIGFKKLKYLKLSNCNVISIPKISVLENLEKLYLNHVELQYDIDITRMQKLNYISLNGSNVPDKEEYIEKLRKQNAEIVIEFEENDLPIE